MDDLEHLQTIDGQRTYYERSLNNALKGNIFDYVIDVIIEYAVDKRAIGFKSIKTFQSNSGALVGCCVLSNGNILSLCFDGSLIVLNGESFEIIGTFRERVLSISGCCALPNGNFITTSKSGDMRLWNVDR